MGKMKFFNNPSGCIIGMLLIFLSACDTPANIPEVVAAKNTPHSHPAKPGASIKLENSQPIFLAAPGISDVELVLSTPPRDGLIQVDISATDGLELISTPSHYEFPLTQNEYTFPVKIHAVSKGRYYINLQISLIHNEQREHRVITAIVQVGEPDLNTQKASSDAAKKAQGDKVISLPAQEVIQPAK